MSLSNVRMYFFSDSFSGREFGTGVFVSIQETSYPIARVAYGVIRAS